MNDEIFDLETAVINEARRRLNLLGELPQLPAFDYEKSRLRSYLTRIPITELNKWYLAFLKEGADGLRPVNWSALSNKECATISQRYQMIQEYADLVQIDMKEAVETIARQNNISKSSAYRWLRRYRIGGLWGLLGKYNPLKSTRPIRLPQRDLGSLDEASLETAYARRNMLGELAEKEMVTEAEVKKRSAEVGVSPRTLWNYRRAYQMEGMVGLAPKKRKGEVQLSPPIADAIVGIRMKYPKISIAEIHRQISQLAQQAGETIPSQWQVRQVCKRIPEAELLWGTGEKKIFRSKYRVSSSITFEGVVYQIDHTLVDVLVRDIRSLKYRTKSGEVRLWLTTCIEANSRCVVAYKFSYDQLQYPT